MLKLKYLFQNIDLAQMILNNWEYDSNDSNFLKYYRISSNAVYWCKNQGNTFFLRFALSTRTLTLVCFERLTRSMTGGLSKLE